MVMSDSNTVSLSYRYQLSAECSSGRIYASNFDNGCQVYMFPLCTEGGGVGGGGLAYRHTYTGEDFSIPHVFLKTVLHIL